MVVRGSDWVVIGLVFNEGGRRRGRGMGRWFEDMERGFLF